MKILVVSDTHGYLESFKKVLHKEKNLDLLIHCGDVEGQSSEIYQMAGVPCYFIQGNNDWSGNLSRELILNLEGHTIFATHGHRYNVSYDMDRIRYAAQEKGADICLYGHTHVPRIDLYDGITFMNPGSLTYPRQRKRVQTYGVIEIDEEQQVKFWLRDTLK